jgi:RNA polymerase sigma-70 factor (ECF subfamily)
MLALLKRLCRNPHDAEDAFQETAVRVWKHLSVKSHPTSPKSWLMTVAYRTFLDLRDRRQAARVPITEVIDVKARPDHAAELNENSRRMLAAIGRLSEANRDVMLLHYTGSLSLRETADALGLSEGTVKSRLNAALTQLRKQLK